MSAVMVWGTILKKKYKNHRPTLQNQRQTLLERDPAKLFVVGLPKNFHQDRTPSHRSGLKRIYWISSQPTNEHQVRLI
jgi:hypothetical protein